MEAIAWGAFWGAVANGARQLVGNEVSAAKARRIDAVNLSSMPQESGMDDHFLTLLENSGGEGHSSTLHLRRAAEHARRAFAVYSSCQAHAAGGIAQAGEALPHYMHMVCLQNSTMAITLLRNGSMLLPPEANRVATSHARLAIEKNLQHLTSCLHSLALIPQSGRLAQRNGGRKSDQGSS